jgi:dolichol-phosphate mannosyltransferase
MSSAVQVRETNVGHGFKPRVFGLVSDRFPLARKFIKFCLVGGSGLCVDMGVLFLLADPRFLGLNVALSKICAAEVAMINNFIWNELWTFREGSVTAKREGAAGSSRKGLARRFLVFNTICGIGIGLAVFLLHLFHAWLGWNLYVSNFIAIVLVTFWNFALNAQFNWQKRNVQVDCQK